MKTIIGKTLNILEKEGRIKFNELDLRNQLFFLETTDNFEKYFQIIKNNFPFQNGIGDYRVCNFVAVVFMFRLENIYNKIKEKLKENALRNFWNRELIENEKYSGFYLAIAVAWMDMELINHFIKLNVSRRLLGLIYQFGTTEMLQFSSLFNVDYRLAIIVAIQESNLEMIRKCYRGEACSVDESALFAGNSNPEVRKVLCKTIIATSVKTGLHSIRFLKDEQEKIEVLEESIKQGYITINDIPEEYKERLSEIVSPIELLKIRSLENIPFEKIPKHLLMEFASFYRSNVLFEYFKNLNLEKGYILNSIWNGAPLLNVVEYVKVETIDNILIWTILLEHKELTFHIINNVFDKHFYRITPFCLAHYNKLRHNRNKLGVDVNFISINDGEALGE